MIGLDPETGPVGQRRGVVGPRLPAGYYLEVDADLLFLRRRPSGELVAAFSARGATKESVEEAAREDRLRRTTPRMAG